MYYSALFKIVFQITCLICNVRGWNDVCDSTPQEKSRCISLEACEQLIPLVKTDPDIVKKFFCGYENFTFKVCCPVPQLTTTKTSIAPEGLATTTCHNMQGKSKYSCVPLKDCRDIRNKYLRKNITLKDIQMLRCKGIDIINVCCEQPKSISISNQIDNKTLEERTSLHKLNPTPKIQSCGKEHFEPKLKIVGGSNARINQYPWLALIKLTGKDRAHCGGSLISNKHVLTATHCILTGSSIVILGEYRLNNSGPDCVKLLGNQKACTDGEVIIPVKDTFMYAKNELEQKTTHPKNDIALVKLIRAVNFSRFIRPICLPTSDITKSPPTNLTFLTAGWGFIDSYSSQTSDIKQQVILPFMKYQKCKSKYKSALSEHQICAGGENGTDTCGGDSGGPLIYKRDNVHELVGVISFGTKQCAIKGVPSIFAKVYDYMEWIKEHMEK